jgi:hypothetical protein
MSKVPICFILYCTPSMSASGQLSAGMGSLHIGAGRAIHHTVPKITIYVFPEKELRGLSPNYYTHMQPCSFTKS